MELSKPSIDGESLKRITVIGGCGHVGLPLAVSLSDSGLFVTAFDINQDVVEEVNQGKSPFYEKNLDEAISSNLGKSFFATSDPNSISDANVIIMIVGTPLDVHLNPDPNAVVNALLEVKEYLKDDQLLILRSTVYPGVTRRIEEVLLRLNRRIPVAFCPERIVEGDAMKELKQLPQIVGVRDNTTFDAAKRVFDLLGVISYRTTPEEAELAKLFTNTWRYIKFAAANQFWMMSNSAGIEYENVRNAIRFEYPRASDLPGAGFAAGPCLFKDTMQLAAFSGNHFQLGNAAMQINEGQPDYIVEKLKEKYPLDKMRVGILGMAFKGESDDRRSSLAYKLKRILIFNSLEVFTSDPYIKDDPMLIPVEELLRKSDLVVIAAPHQIFKQLSIATPVVDIWNLLEFGTMV
jgi:UDP-N-acetyl-D-mannosaminuronic acid dehydrogenase